MDRYDARDFERCRLLISERVWWDDPDEVCSSLGILGKSSFVGKRCSVHKTSYMISDLCAGDVLADFDNVPGEVTA